MNREVRDTMLKSRPTSIDLFAGVGGLSLGLEWAGFFSAVHVEIEEITSRYAEYNFPLATHRTGEVRGDVRKVTGAQLISDAGVREVDVIAGGPPCQGFSNVGRGQTDDPLNDLVLEMARLVLEVRPKAFIIENVPGINRSQYWQLEEALRRLATVYRIAPPATLSALSFGVPQQRKRLFIIGYRRDLGISPSVPQPSHRLPTGRTSFLVDMTTPTVADAIYDLPNCDDYEYLIDGDETPYVVAPSAPYALMLRNVSELDQQRGYHIAWDESLCTNVRRTQHGDDLMARLAGLPEGAADRVSRIKRLESGGVSTTIRAGTTADRGAWSAPRPCHPLYPRVLTTRECARLQSFPDWFRFHPSKWHGNRQVGNAVPPLLAMAVGMQVARDLGLMTKPIVPVSVARDDAHIRIDVQEASAAGLSKKRTTHKVVGTDAEARRRGTPSRTGTSYPGGAGVGSS